MMGVLPLQFLPGERRELARPDGRELFAIVGRRERRAREVTVPADDRAFAPRSWPDYGPRRATTCSRGILQYVLPACGVE